MQKRHNLDYDDRNPTQAVGDHNAEETDREDRILSFATDEHRPGMLSVAFNYVKHYEV